MGHPGKGSAVQGRRGPLFMVGTGNDLVVSRATPEGVLRFRPSEANQHRVSELIARQHDGTLSAEEASELDDVVQIEHVDHAKAP